MRQINTRPAPVFEVLFAYLFSVRCLFSVFFSVANSNSYAQNRMVTTTTFGAWKNKRKNVRFINESCFGIHLVLFFKNLNAFRFASRAVLFFFKWICYNLASALYSICFYILILNGSITLHQNLFAAIFVIPTIKHAK